MTHAQKSHCTAAGLPAFRQWSWLFILLALATITKAAAPEITAALRVGDYRPAIELAERYLLDNPNDEEAHVLLVRAYLTVGDNEAAYTAAARATSRNPRSVRIGWAAREAAIATGNTEVSDQLLTEVRATYNASPSFYSDPANRAVVSRIALLLGLDPKLVLDNFLNPALQVDPKLRDLYLAKGDLALSKHDYDIAARTYQEGLREIPDDPDLNYGLARSFEPSDRPAMIGAVEAALEVNPRHLPSLLLLAEHEIAGEDYAGAERILDQVRAVNPSHPDEWAFRAVIAHLRNQPEVEREARSRALASRPGNPRVDYLIGKKLAEKYRFAEAAEAQRRALALDPNYLPAKSELAVDLLRLGEEDEGWRLAEEVSRADEYDVEAFNLMTLHDTLDQYAVLRTGNFQVRMPAREAEIYGSRVIELLESAHEQMTRKYGMVPESPTFVELFGDPKDFAVRTFGMPDVAGFLGVCFGRVLTANGPAAAVGTNWEAVLWHEFCHVITLQMTRNRMPRWLSEGISVYEEELADPSWGMDLSPGYRERILGGDMTPVGELSAAFLSPRDAEDLQFAYFQSYLVVKYLFERHGEEDVRAILRDLGTGEDINVAIARHTSPIETIEREFQAFAREQAESIATGLAWEAPDREMMERGDPAEIGTWAESNPDNYWGLVWRARDAISQDNWIAAEQILRRLISAYPGQTGVDSAYRYLSLVQRETGDTAGERETLARVAELESEAIEFYLRLMELSERAGDWETLARVSERYLAVNPMVLPPFRYLARATTGLGRNTEAISALRSMVVLEPPDPANVHYQLADLLHREGDPEARRQVLMALEEAPRYRDALRLLVDLNAPPPQATFPADIPDATVMPTPSIQVTPARQ